MESLHSFAAGAGEAVGRARAETLSTQGIDSLSEYTLPGNPTIQLCDTDSQFLGRISVSGCYRVIMVQCFKTSVLCF